MTRTGLLLLQIADSRVGLKQCAFCTALYTASHLHTDPSPASAAPQCRRASGLC
uniref:Uncharacterized protein n=1 Tax=Anguilla anguilla TaxID=7936 RepID=A0A0E9SX49_ANGAN